MFCGPSAAWNGWHMGGWFMPGFLMLIFFAGFVWLFFRRQPAPSVPMASCPNCSGRIHTAYFRCPHCGESLKHNCPSCSRIIEHNWSYCPYCNENQTTATTKPGKPKNLTQNS